MPALYLTEDDVRKVVDMPAAINIVERAIKHLADGKATNVPRNRASAPGIILHSMSSADEYLGTCGWKQYTTTKHGARFLVGLYDNAGGDIAALIEADYLGQLRTGAVTGVAVRRLARSDANRVGVFGTGAQARTQLEAVAAALPIKQALVYSRDAQRRAQFCETMASRLGIAVESVAEPAAAVRGLPIVVTATTSKTPVFNGDDVGPGTVVCAVGSNWLNKAEIDTATVARAARVVCDDVAACRHEAGDLVPALEVGVFRWEQAVSLGDVLAGRAVGRTTDDDVLVFKSVGLAVEDVAMATEILSQAKAANLGTPLPFGHD